MSNRRLRTLALASTAFAGMTGVPAEAQEGTAPAAPAAASDAAASPAPSGSTAAEPNADGIQDIIVTAQRRSESVQKSSLSIQVLSGDVIQRAGTTQAQDLNVLVPGIQVATVGSTVQISIRGISDSSSNALGNPSVAFNVDGVYIGRPTAISNNFFDVSRIEVLKGPQGTLYGRNASGGAINLITNAPTIGEDSGYFEGELGNYSLARVAGAFNKSFGDTFAVRAAFQDIDRHGYLSDGANDQKGTAGRVRALWRPNSDVSLLLNFDAANQRGKGSETVLRPRLAGQDPWDATNTPDGAARLAAATPPPLLFGLVSQGQPRQNNSFINASAQLDWNFGAATLTVIPAYRRTRENYDVWNGFLYRQINKTTQKSLEARLSHNSDVFKWVVGGYYFDERSEVQATATTSLLIQNLRNDYVPITKSYAGFGEATYSIAPTLRLIGGARYTSEPRRISGVTIDDSLVRGPLAGTVVEIISGRKRFSSVTWKAGAEFDLTPRNMLFATASTGFKAGGFNIEESTAASPNFYKPEKLRAYVAGLRNRFLDNRLQINLEGFYYDYRNKQESAIGPTTGGNLAFITTNAGKARIFGGSADIVFRPTSTDTFQLFGEYNNNKYKRFVYQVPTAVFNPFSSTCAETPGPVLTTVDCSGRGLVKAPKWVGSFGYDHRFDLGNGTVVTAAVDGQLSAKQIIGTDYLLGESDNGYVLVNASLTYVAPNKRWTLTGYVKNITDEATYKSGNALPLQAPLVDAVIGDPRTYGARVRFNF